MGMSVKGYVLEPPRVGAANSPFTFTPNVAVTNQTVYDAHFTADESAPRVEYFVTVIPDGTLKNQDGSIAEGRFLRDAKFAWTKNEGTVDRSFDRFTYNDRSNSFKLLPGGLPLALGAIGPDLNTDGKRFKIAVPVEALKLVAPYRLSRGTENLGQPGTTLTLDIVQAFGSPAAGHVEVLLSSGELNWNTQDLTTYAGQVVRFQQQAFFQPDVSDGYIGTVANAGGLAAPLLNPIPAADQYPMLRFGRSLWLEPIAKPDDEQMWQSSHPATGKFYWSATTGSARFNPDDIATYLTENIYYDGVFIKWGLSLDRYDLGDPGAGGVSGLPIPMDANAFGSLWDGGDLIFFDENGEQFNVVKVKAEKDFSNPFFGLAANTIEVKRDRSYQISSWNFDSSLTFVPGDLNIEYGISLRLFRNVVNPNAEADGVKDLTLYWNSSGDRVAVLASPIAAAPYVTLPATPLKDALVPFKVQIEAGTGTREGELIDLSVPTPDTAYEYGYVLDIKQKQLKFAHRHNAKVLSLPNSVSILQLSDPLVLGSNYTFELETAVGSDVYLPLAENVDFVIDKDPGVLTLTNTVGEVAYRGPDGQLVSGTFKVNTPLTTQLGDVLVVETGSAKGVYRLAAGDAQAGVPTDVPGANASSFSYQVWRDPEPAADRYWQAVSFPDPNTKIERIVWLGPIANEQHLITVLVGQFDTPTQYSTVAAHNFIAAGVQVGDTLQITSGADANTSHRITGVQQNQLTIQDSIQLVGANVQVRVYRRLQLPPTDVTATRFRFGATFNEYGQTVEVATDHDFSTTLTTGQVEVSLETRNLNFSAADIPTTTPPTLYWVRRLTNKEYTLNPQLSPPFIEFAERLLADEEAIVTYIPLDESGQKLPIQQERITFDIIGEVTTPYPREDFTSTLKFNPLGREVASKPFPTVRRNGSTQGPNEVEIDLTTSTIKVLPLDKPNSIPQEQYARGVPVLPNERITVNYSVFNAVGGEQNATLSQPIYAASLVLSEYSNVFTVESDRTALLPVGYLFRVDKKEVYRIASSVYDAATNLTTVTLAAGEYFSNDYVNPYIELMSGPVDATAFKAAFFITDSLPYQSVARGMNKVKLPGDRTPAYSIGKVIQFTNSADPATATYIDHYILGNVAYDKGFTELTLTENVKRQYVLGKDFLKYSVRPVLEEGTTRAKMSRPVVMTLPRGIYRKVDGEVGQLRPDYSLDNAGVVDFQTALAPHEEVAVFYTGQQATVPGVRLRYSYTHSIVPSDSTGNGILGQVLTMEYTIWSADTFYFRVEPLSRFKAEVQAYFRTQAQGSSPSSGPSTSNAPGNPALPEKGRESIFYTEGHVANMDFVAVKYLKYINDSIHNLEDALQCLDGRVVGSTDGRFRFDGVLGQVRESYSAVTNDIDDILYVDDEWVWDGWLPNTQKIYEPMWRPHRYSRFYPELVAATWGKVNAYDPENAKNGDFLLQFNQKDFASIPGDVRRRYPRALVTADAPIMATEISVDSANGSDAMSLPSFTGPDATTDPVRVGMLVKFLDRAGNQIGEDRLVTETPAAAPAIAQTLKVAPISAAVPRGSTVTLSDLDVDYKKEYSTFLSVSLDAVKGQLTYTAPFFGLGEPPGPNEYLELLDVGILNKSTAPFRFPALDGLTATDDNDLGLPILGNTADSETTAIVGISTGADFLLSTSGHVSSTDPIEDIDLDATGTVLTCTDGPLPGPTIGLPQIRRGDLVRFLDGPNANDHWRRIVGVTANTLTVDAAFTNVSTTGNTILTTAADTMASGTCTVTAVPTVINVGTADTTNVQAGHTIIITDDPAYTNVNRGQRRQVRSIVPDPVNGTLITVDLALTTSATPATFVITNSLSTYDGWKQAVNPTAPTLGSLSGTDVLAFVKTNSNSEIGAVTKFLDGSSTTDGVLTDLLPAGTHSGTAAADVLTDTTANFSPSLVGSYLYVNADTGPNRGVYAITEVTPTTLKISEPFPQDGAISSYRVVTAANISAGGLKDLIALLNACKDWATILENWSALLNSTDYAMSPGGDQLQFYVSNIQNSDVLAYVDAVNARKALLSPPPAYPSQPAPYPSTDPANPVNVLTTILSSRDQLYNKRFVWIDGRINQQSGLLAIKRRVRVTREENLAKQKNDLIKLASVSE